MANIEMQLKSGSDNIYSVIANRVIESNTDLDDCMDIGVWNCYSAAVAATLTHSPVSNAGFPMLVLPVGSSTARMQVIFAGSNIYSRRRTTSSWGSWTTF